MQNSLFVYSYCDIYCHIVVIKLNILLIVKSSEIGKASGATVHGVVCGMGGPVPSRAVARFYNVADFDRGIQVQLYISLSFYSASLP